MKRSLIICTPPLVLMQLLVSFSPSMMQNHDTESERLVGEDKEGKKGIMELGRREGKN